MPAEVAGEQFYRPSAHGAEPALYAAIEARRGQRPGGRKQVERNRATMATAQATATVQGRELNVGG